MKNTKKIVIAGVMTGTSCDGLDVAALEFDPQGWGPLWEESVEYPLLLRKRVLQLQEKGRKTALKEVCELNRDLGIWYAKVLGLALQGKKPPYRPQVIANHGQTVGHYPSENKGGMSLQLGDPSWIAAQTGLTVVSHFRQGDLSLGGEGAPLVPAFLKLLMDSLSLEKQGRKRKMENSVFHNLGGISNFTLFTPQGEVVAGDTGPANILIDAATSYVTQGRCLFDRDGQLALQGEVDQRKLKKLLKHPFFKKEFPKSTGRDDFPIDWLKESLRGVPVKNWVPTATALTVESILDSYEQLTSRWGTIGQVCFSGGGVKNPVLMSWIQSGLLSTPTRRFRPLIREVSTLERWGLSSQYLEAQAFSYLGYRSLLGYPVGGVWTGVNEFSPPGWITPGKNWMDVLNRLF